MITGKRGLRGGEVDVAELTVPDRWEVIRSALSLPPPLLHLPPPLIITRLFSFFPLIFLTVAFSVVHDLSSPLTETTLLPPFFFPSPFSIYSPACLVPASPPPPPFPLSPPSSLSSLWAGPCQGVCLSPSFDMPLMMARWGNTTLCMSLHIFSLLYSYAHPLPSQNVML